MQHLSQTAQTDGINLSGTSDIKAAENFTDKFDKMESVAESYNSSFSKIQGLKDLQSVAQSKDLSVSNSLVNPFTDYLFEQNHQDIGRVQAALKNPEQMDSYASDFLSTYKRGFEAKKPDLVSTHLQNKDAAIQSFNDPSREVFSVHDNVAPDMHLNSEFKNRASRSRDSLERMEPQVGAKNPGIIQVQNPGDRKPLELIKARKNAPIPLDKRNFQQIVADSEGIPKELSQKTGEFDKKEFLSGMREKTHVGKTAKKTKEIFSSVDNFERFLMDIFPPPENCTRVYPEKKKPDE